MTYDELVERLDNEPIKDVIDEALEYLPIAELDEIEIILYIISMRKTEEDIEKYAQAILIANRRYGELDYSDDYLIDLRHLYYTHPNNVKLAEMFCDLLCYCICTYPDYQEDYNLEELLKIGKSHIYSDSVKLNQVVSIIYTYINELSVEEIKDKIIEVIGEEKSLK